MATEYTVFRRVTLDELTEAVTAYAAATKERPTEDADFLAPDAELWLEVGNIVTAGASPAITDTAEQGNRGGEYMAVPFSNITKHPVELERTPRAKIVRSE